MIELILICCGIFIGTCWIYSHLCDRFARQIFRILTEFGILFFTLFGLVIWFKSLLK